VMIIVASLIFYLFQFPHQGKIVTIDWIHYYTPNLHDHIDTNVPFLEYFVSLYESVGEGLLKDSSLMGNVPLSSPNPPYQISMVNTILNLSQ
jgi:hypothetical protein